MAWRKSSRSYGSDDCIELARLSVAEFGVRDSKAPDAGTLLLDADQCRRLLGLARLC